MNHPQIVKLFGDPLENFYQLGLRDKDSYAETFKSLENFLKIANGPINKILLGPRQLFAQTLFKRDKFFKSKAEAYSQGLGISAANFAASLLIPELLCSLHFWPSGGIFSLLGCSSMFSANERGELLHGRILDFPLVGSDDLNERVLVMKFSGEQGIFSLGTSGLPYPVLTAMNESGMTLGLHQKFSDFFYPKGRPIFEIIYDLLLQCHDKRSALKYLRSQKSLSSWGLYMGFPSGEVLAVDLLGENFHKQEYSVITPERGISTLYFSNLLIKPKGSKNILPLGLTPYCEMRENIFNKLWNRKKLSLEKRKKPLACSELDMLEILGRGFSGRTKTAKAWELGPRTPFSLSISVFNSQNHSVSIISGSAPKMLGNTYLTLENPWRNNQWEEKKSHLSEVPSDYQKGSSHYALAQKYLDEHDFHLSFHHIQLCVEFWSPYPEGKVGQFFLLCMQYLHVSSAQDWSVLLEAFENIQEELPSYLADHCVLMRGRLEKICQVPTTTNKKSIQHKSLQAIYEWEQDLNPLAIKWARKLSIIRLDLMDIIYLYAHSPELKNKNFTNKKTKSISQQYRV